MFDRRLDFLNLCPAPDLAADVRSLIASYGETCQPAQLVAYLNQQIGWCGLRNLDGNTDCRPTGDAWRMCAPFYNYPVTAYEAPRLHEQCEEVPDADGSMVLRCTYTWGLADAPLPAGG